MIIDLQKFIREERPVWTELETVLKSRERDPHRRMSIKEIQRFHYLYQRASADLARIMTFSSEPEIKGYLETLVERSYGEIHETREKPYRLSPGHWFFITFPRTFRGHVKAFWLALVVMLMGAVFGGLAISFDPEAKRVIMPWPHLTGSPSERVATEESAGHDDLAGYRSRFSSYLMTHNTRVAVLTLALGLTYGVGTIILLFYNGVILGAVALDYILSGEALFLAGWLLPHGTVEIPAILIAGQAGLVLAEALIGRGRPESLRTRLRLISGDLVTLIFGVALLLVWAGLIESFFSQYHEPYVPYGVKIAFGMLELALLFGFLFRSGHKGERKEA
jgi:uncharacterized membrane protein SpoIIM required for sporulation